MIFAWKVRNGFRLYKLRCSEEQNLYEWPEYELVFRMRWLFNSQIGMFFRKNEE